MRGSEEVIFDTGHQNTPIMLNRILVALTSKRKFFVLLILLTFNSVLVAAERKLIWQDEFNIDGLPDATKWMHEVGYLRNKELQLYTKDSLSNTRVASGHLIIEAHQTPAPSAKGFTSWFSSLFDDKSTYTSGSLKTEHIPGWQYGRIEVRAKLPQGRGVWPAIWLLGKNIRQVGWPMSGEIDIMEYVGFKPNVIHGVVHTKSKNHKKKNAPSGRINIDDLATEFHVYAVERTAQRIDFWIDDKLYHSVEKEENSLESWPFDQPMYLIINFAVGGSWGGQKGVDNRIFPQQFIIDYVRVYDEGK